MHSSQPQDHTPAHALFEYAIDPQDVKWLLDQLPNEYDDFKNTIEYELRLLKIVVTGWAIQLCVQGGQSNEKTAEEFWTAIYEFSARISETASLTMDARIDYFGLVKERLDLYLTVMTEQGERGQPASTVGECFARLCDRNQDLLTVHTGARLFVSVVERVHRFLSGEEPEKVH